MLHGSRARKESRRAAWDDDLEATRTLGDAGGDQRRDNRQSRQGSEDCLKEG